MMMTRTDNIDEEEEDELCTVQTNNIYRNDKTKEEEQELSN